MMRTPVVAVAPGALYLLLLATPGSSPAQKVDFTGSWVLDEKESDNPRGQFEGAGGRQPGMNPGSGGRPSGERPSGGRGGTMSQEDMEQMRAMMQSVMQASEALRIVQDDSTFVVVDLEGTLRVHHPDGREKSYPLEGVGYVESRAKWDDDKLVVELRMDGGIRVTRTYELDEEDRQLHVRVRMEGGQLPRTTNFRRVYDFVGEEGEG
jgi:hypothetical protein